MVIIAQDEKSIYDLEKFSSATAKEDGTVYLLNYSGELAFPVGKYETEERAIDFSSCAIITIVFPLNKNEPTTQKVIGSTALTVFLLAGLSTCTVSTLHQNIL